MAKFLVRDEEDSDLDQETNYYEDPAQPQTEEREEELPEILDESFFGDFLPDVQATIRDLIGRYFDGKEMYCGGEIPKSVLHAEEYVSLVLNTDVISGMDIVYDAIARSGQYQTESEHGVSEDVKHVIDLIHEIKKFGVPKPFITGILLMHLELCEGMSISE